MSLVVKWSIVWIWGLPGFQGKTGGYSVLELWLLWIVHVKQAVSRPICQCAVVYHQIHWCRSSCMFVNMFVWTWATWSCLNDELVFSFIAQWGCYGRWSIPHMCSAYEDVSLLFLTECDDRYGAGSNATHHWVLESSRRGCEPSFCLRVFMEYFLWFLFNYSSIWLIS